MKPHSFQILIGNSHGAKLQIIFHEIYGCGAPQEENNYIKLPTAAVMNHCIVAEEIHCSSSH